MDRRYGERNAPGFRGFTLIELLAVLVLLGLMVLFGSRVLTTVVRGYSTARSADEVVQKAQMALQRMTVEFAYIDVSASSGSSNSITYNSINNIVGIHTICQVGNNLMYQVGSNNYILTDSLSANGITFLYFDNYSATASTTMSANTNIVGINLVMHGDDWNTTVNKTFSTRVTLNKFNIN